MKLLFVIALLTFYVGDKCTSQQIKSCVRAVDIAFLLDCSSTLDGTSWRNLLTFMTGMLQKFDISQYGTHYRVIMFGDSVQTVQTGDFTAFFPTDGMRNCGDNHNLSTAIRTARTSYFATSYYSSSSTYTNQRPEVPDVLVVFTSGQPMDVNATLLEAELCRADGIKIVAVAIGPDVDTSELAMLAAITSSSSPLTVTNTQALGDNLASFMNAVCDFPVEGEQNDLRLVDGLVPGSGRLEVYLNQEWATVCDDFWTTVSTRIACRQLGFNQSVPRQAPAGSATGRARRIGINHLQCQGREAAITDCRRTESYYPVGFNPPPVVYFQVGCSHSEDVFLFCCSDSSTCRQTFGITKAPQQVRVESGTDVFLQCIFTENVTDDLEIEFLARKNPILLLRRVNGTVGLEATEFPTGS